MIMSIVQKTVLTIAGSDPSGGAGIQADLKTMEAHRVYGMSVVTALTAQNTLGITGILPVEKNFVEKQIQAVCEDIPPDAVKIGMLPDRSVMEVVAKAIDKYSLKNVVLDPVLSSTSGTELTRIEETDYLKKQLFCRSLLITPNIPEAQTLLSTKKGRAKEFLIDSREAMEDAAQKLSSEYGCNVLIKGGHSSFEREDVSADLLCIRPLGNAIDTDFQVIWFEGKKFDNPNTHGTGCTLSSAIASNLAKGHDLKSAVLEAKKYIEKCIDAGLKLGSGRGPLLH